LAIVIVLVLVIFLLIYRSRFKSSSAKLVKVKKILLSNIKSLKKEMGLLYPDLDVDDIDLKSEIDISDVGKAVKCFKNVIDKKSMLVSLILNNILSGVLVINNGKEIFEINKSLLNLLHLDKKEIIGKKTIFIFKNKQFENLVTKTLQTRVLNRKNIIFYRDDEDIHFEIEAIPVLFNEDSVTKENKAEENKDINLLILFKNITQEVEFSKLRSQFVANISHEMRTPLTSIRGFLETIAGDESVRNQKIKSYLSKSLKEVSRLNYLIEDILNLSNIEYKRNILFRKDYNLNDIIKDSIDSLIFLARQNDVRVDFKYSNDPINYQTDEELFRQMVKNIIENSIFYAGKGVKLSIGIKENKDSVLLQFKDNGIGINREELPYIFQRFYRGKNLKSSKQIGSGLGLSIVKHIVELHNGEISVDSTLNKETKFSIILPKKSI
jgi:two-component system phosphate regulon sensor histidine kinase PhoR